MNQFLEQQVRDAILSADLKAAEQNATVAPNTIVLAEEINLFLTVERRKSHLQRAYDRAIESARTITTKLGYRRQLILHPPKQMIIGLGLVISLAALASPVIALTNTRPPKSTPTPLQTIVSGRQNPPIFTCPNESLAKCISNLSLSTPYISSP